VTFVLGRRSFVTAGVAAALTPAGARAAEKPVPGDGHRRSGPKLRVRGRLVEGMLAIPVTLGERGPFLFEVATIGRGFSIRSELVAATGAEARSEGEVALGRPRTGDLALAGGSSAKLLPPGWPMPQPLDGIVGLDVFGDLSLILDFGSAELGAGPANLAEPDGRTIFAYRDFDAPVVPVTVAGVTFPARISTGQIRAPLLLTPDLAAKVAASAPEAAGEAYLGAQKFELKRIALAGAARVGTTRLAAASALYPPPTDENSLGAQALQGLVLQLDRRNRRVRLLPSG